MQETYSSTHIDGGFWSWKDVTGSSEILSSCLVHRATGSCIRAAGANGRHSAATDSVVSIPNVDFGADVDTGNCFVAFVARSSAMTPGRWPQRQRAARVDYVWCGRTSRVES